VLALGWGAASAQEAAPPATETGAAAATAAEATPADEASAPAAEPAVQSEAAAGEEKWSFRVFADERYRFRASAAPDERDQDLRLYFDFGAADPSDHIGTDLAFGFWWDLDGSPSEDAVTAFASPRDSGNDVWFDVYRLSAEYHSSGVVELVRAGRQTAEHGKPLVFDGASVVLRPVSPYLELFVHGGRSVHFFEIDQGLFEDWLASVGVVVRPLPDLRLEADYLFTIEDRIIEANTEELVKSDQTTDHEAGLTAWYRWEWLNVKAYLRSLNDGLSLVGGDLRFEWPDKLAGVEVGAKAQPMTIDEATEASDPYLVALGKSLPFAKFHLDAWKGYQTCWGLYAIHLGYEGRQLIDHDAEPFNRNFGRAYVLLTGSDLGVKGPFVSLVFERWGDSPALTGDGLWTVGGSAGYDHPYVRLEAGTNYQRWKYDYYRDLNERADVQTVFVDAKGKLLGWLSLFTRYEFERFDRDVHTVVVGLSQNY